MAHDLDSALGALLDRYDANRRALDERKRKVEADESAFQAGFADLRVRVIRPVFEAGGAILKARGHGFSITEIESAVQADGKRTEAAIAIHVRAAADPAPADPLPSLAFVTRHYNKSVCILSSHAVPRPNGPGGSRGDFRLTQVDRDLVQSELLQLVAGIVDA